MEFNNDDEVQEIVIIENRDQKIERLIADLMSGEKSLSYSAMKAFRESPNDFIEYALREKKQTDAMFLGTVVHCLVLEPEKFAERYMIMDDAEICLQIGGAKPRATTKYKEWKAEFYAACGDKYQVVSSVIYKAAKFIADTVKNNRASRKVLAMCTESEQAIEWEYKNFRFRGFIDKIGEKCIIDLKLVKDAQAKKAQRTIIDMWYHGQAAMYLTAKEIMIPYYIICVDRKGGVSVHKLHKHLIEHGFEEYENLVLKFNECLLKERFDESFDFWAEQWDGIYIADKPAYMY